MTCSWSIKTQDCVKMTIDFGLNNDNFTELTTSGLTCQHSTDWAICWGSPYFVNIFVRGLPVRSHTWRKNFLPPRGIQLVAKTYPVISLVAYSETKY